jgi:hypothetical protein
MNSCKSDSLHSWLLLEEFSITRFDSGGRLLAVATRTDKINVGLRLC